jgi:transposase InsO family protein
VEIRAIHAESEQTYGSPRMRKELNERGFSCSENRVARLMKREGIAGIQRRRFRVVTTDSKHQEPIAENVIDQNFTAQAPGEKLGCDITYIPTREGFIYLAVVIDFFSRAVVGYALGDSLESGLACRALVMAVGRSRLPSDLVHHSDRGVQYACFRYRRLLKSLGMRQSMSRKGNCYDNALVESFFHTLKVERVHRRHYDTKARAMADIVNYIERWYNTKRRHSSIGMQSPQSFLRQWRTAA